MSPTLDRRWTIAQFFCYCIESKILPDLYDMFSVCVSSFTDVHGESLCCFDLGTEELQNVQWSWRLIPDAGAGGQCIPLVLYHCHNVRFNLLVTIWPAHIIPKRFMIGEGGGDWRVPACDSVDEWLYGIIVNGDTGRGLLWHVLSWKCSLECMVWTLISTVGESDVNWINQISIK